MQGKNNLFFLAFNLSNRQFSCIDAQEVSPTAKGPRKIRSTIAQLSPRIKTFDRLVKTKEKFDIILFDTPPLIAVTDAFVITKFINKFLLVIRASRTQKGALERSLSNMDNMGNNIDGVIFNGVDESSTYGGGYYYNYYQYYYGNDNNK